MSLELSERQWKLTCTTGVGDARYRRTIAAWAWPELLKVIGAARRRFGLAVDGPVAQLLRGRAARGLRSIAFWWRTGSRIVVLDPASLRVDRRARRVKTDRVDGNGLVVALIHWRAGDREALRAVRVPPPAQEAAREVSRELAALTSECTRYTNQIRSLLHAQGVRVSLEGDFVTRLAAATDWAGAPVSAPLQARVRRVWERRRTVIAQMRELERTAQAAIRQDTLPGAAAIRQLQQVRGHWVPRQCDADAGAVCVAGLSESAAGGRVSGVGERAVSEWRSGARPRHRQSGEPPRPARVDSAGLGVAALAAAQCPDTVV